MDNIFADTAYGKAALKKLSPVAENFMLFECGWLGDKPEEMTVIKCTGCEFRESKKGKHKGKLHIPIKGTTRTVYLTQDEINKGDKNNDSR